MKSKNKQFNQNEKKVIPQVNFCTQCGSPTEQGIPEGDDRIRQICTKCGFIHYHNPKMVVGSIPTWEDKILLVKRAIEPCYGKWTLPAGYLENGESVVDGARRETREEANATLGDMTPFGMFNLTQINQIYFMFYSDLLSADFGAGHESLEVDLFTEDEIPWDEIAFKVIKLTLERFFEDRKANNFTFHMENLYFERSTKDRT